MSDVVIANDYNYLIIQMLGWDYNLWSVIIVDVASIILIFLGFFILWCIWSLFGWYVKNR